MGRKQYEIAFQLGAKVQSSLGSSFGVAQRNINGLNKGLKQTQRQASIARRTVKFLGAAGATYLTFDVLKTATKNAYQFKDQLKDVATLLDGDIPGKIAKMGNQVKKLAITTGISTDMLNQGLYQTVSAFGESEEATKQAAIAAKVAKGGNAQVADSVSFLAAVTKGYGDTSLKATQKAADLAFMTTKLGQTTIPELAANMGKVIPLASTLKVKQEELFGAMSTLTGVTGNTAEVSTQLRATLQGFMQPSKDMSKALKKIGYANGAAALKSEDLQDILVKLKKAVNNDEIAFANLFGSVEAKNAVLALTGAQADNFIKKTKAMNNALGATDKAFKEKLNPIDRLKQLGNVTVISLGQKALPVVENLATKVLDLYENKDKLITKTNEFIDTYSPLIVGVSASLAVWSAYQLALKGITLWSTITTRATTILNGAMAFLTSPIGMVVIAVGVLVAIGWYLYKNWDKISTGVIDLWQNTVVPFFVGIGEWFANLWNVMVNGFKSAFRGIGEFLKNIFNGVVNIFKGYVNIWIRIINFLTGSLNKLSIKIPDGVPKIGGKTFGFHIREIPMLAKGTNNFAGGLAVVGERGRELVNMPRGSRVTPNNRTEKLLAGLSGGGSNVQINYSPQYIIKGSTDVETVKKAGDMSQQEFERRYDRMLNRRKRLRFAGA